MEANLVVNISPGGAVSGSKQVKRAINTVRKNARGMTREVDGSFNSLRNNLFSIRNVIATLGLVEFIRKSVNSIADFETGLVGIGKTTGIEGKKLRKLGDDIIAMSKKLPVAREELLGIAQAAGQLGIQGTADILLFTETIAKLGKASNLAGEEAAITLARILGVTGEAVSSVENLASTLVYLGNTSKATEAEIAKMVIELAKGTAQFDVSSANLAGLGVTLKEFGQQAELARSTVLRTFLAMASAVNEGGSSLEYLAKLTGTTADQFKKNFKEDSFSSFMQLIKALRMVIDSGGNAESVLANLGLRGSEVNAILPLLAKRYENLSKKVDDANRAYKENTALNKEAEQAFSTFRSKLIKFGNNMLDIARIIGGELAPGITILTDKLTTFFNSDTAIIFAQALGSSFTFLAENIELAVFAFSLFAINRTITLFGSLTKAVIGSARAFKLQATEAILSAATMKKYSRGAFAYASSANMVSVNSKKISLSTKLAAGGMFLLNSALGLIGLNTGMLSSLFSVISGGISKFLSLGAVSKVASVGVRGLAIAFGILTGPIGIVIGIVTALYTAFNFFEDSIINIGSLNASVGNTLQAIWTVTTDILMEKIGRAKDFVVSKFNNIKESISNFVSESILKIKSFFSPVTEVFTQVKDYASNRLDEILQKVKDIVQPIIDTFRNMKEKITGFFSDTFESVKTSLSNFADNIFGGYVDKVVEKANDLQEAENKIKNVGTVAEETGKKIAGISNIPTKPSYKPANDNNPFAGGSFGSVDVKDTVSNKLTEAEKRTQQFNSRFESTLTNGFANIFENGNQGFKSMLGNFKTMYFEMMAEFAAKPLIEALLGDKNSKTGERSGGGLSNIISSLFGNKDSSKKESGGGFLSSIGSMFGFGDKQGENLASSFASESSGSGGFLSSLTSIFSNSGEGGGFLSSMGSIFSNFSSGFGSMLSGFGGGAMSAGMGGAMAGGGIGPTIGAIAGNFLMPGVGGMIGGALGGLLGFARGGSVVGGNPIVVGERGPELFVPPYNGEIIPNHKVAAYRNPANDNMKMAEKVMSMNNFDGYRASGGNVSQNMPVVVGERKRELYMPDISSQKPSSSQNSNSGGVTVQINVSTPDANSFRKSQGQIASEAARAINRAKRNL